MATVGRISAWQEREAQGFLWQKSNLVARPTSTRLVLIKYLRGMTDAVVFACAGRTIMNNPR